MRTLGYEHTPLDQLRVSLDGALLAKVVLAGVAFGLAGRTYLALHHAVAGLAKRWINWPPAWPVAGAAMVLALAGLFGRDYVGLSTPLAEMALAGSAAGFSVFALKIVFTAVTLGSGFVGGEVTPLFVTGAALGAALAGPLNVEVGVLAAVGFVAVFAGASKTPLACAVMSVELFGADALALSALACLVAAVCSGPRGLYPKGSEATTSQTDSGPQTPYLARRFWPRNVG